MLSLALGMGPHALFSVVDAVLLKSCPGRTRPAGAAEVARECRFRPGGYNGLPTAEDSGRCQKLLPYQTYAALRARKQDALSDVFAFGGVSLNLSADGQADVATGQAVSGNYYSALGVEALHGRTLTDEDDKPSATPVAVVSHRFWERRFDGDPSVVGRQVNLNNVAFTIVGVTPRGFNGTMEVGASPDVSIPLARSRRSAQAFASVGRRTVVAASDGQAQGGGDGRAGARRAGGVFQQSVVEHRETRRALRRRGRADAAAEPADYPRLAVEAGAQGEMNIALITSGRSTCCSAWSPWCFWSRAPTWRTFCWARGARGRGRSRCASRWARAAASERQLLTERVARGLVGGARRVSCAFG